MRCLRSVMGPSFSRKYFYLCVGAVAALLAFPPQIARADEGGVSFWLPGFFGSLAAVPAQTPGWSVTSIYWHDSVSAGADVARAREIQIGRFPANLTANVSANVNANLDLTLLIGTYTFATPVLGGQASASLMGIYGNNSTSLAGSLTGTLTGPGGGTFPFSRFDSIDSSLTAFGDLYPTFQLKWNAGVNNFMTYVTGDIPVGAYQSTRLANIGIGHWAIDAGGGYTYFNPQTGHEASAVLGFTYNFIDPSTQYQNGVDMHLDWGVSQFLTKQVQVGLVGYLYQEIGCDSGTGDRVGCFQSRVVGVGPQFGYLFPVGDMQGYLNLKAYGEFDNANRPAGWNLWLTFNLSPAAATPPTSSRPRFTK
jgi:hypothetical protein